MKYKIITYLDIRKIANFVSRLSSSEVILTDERRKHIYMKHSSDYLRIRRGLRKTIDNPTLIYASTKDHNTLLYIRKLSKNNQNVVVRLSINNDKKHPENSIITSWIVRDSYVKVIDKNNILIYNEYSEK